MHTQPQQSREAMQQDLFGAATNAIVAFPSIELVANPGLAFKLESNDCFPFDSILTMVDAHASAVEKLSEIIGVNNLYNNEVLRKKEKTRGIYISEVQRKSGTSTQVKIATVFADQPKKKSITVTFNANKIDTAFILAIAEQIKGLEEQGAPISYDDAKDCFKYLLKHYQGASVIEFLTRLNGWYDIEVASSIQQYVMQPVIRAKGSRIMPDNTSFQSKHGRGNIIISKGGKRMSLSFNNSPIKQIQSLALEWLKENVTNTLQINESTKNNLRQSWKNLLLMAEVDKEATH
ncbi:hypothetical protein LMH73_027645 [Vibrio splendidus]|nr:hypothetical protein [Vibrio splendidus]MCC4880878.1 hypothetical protein [Vibrio splendidus]